MSNEGVTGWKRVKLEIDGTEVGALVNVQCPGMERDEVELTAIQDDEMNFDVTGPIDRGVLNANQRWIPGDTNHELLDAAMEANADSAFKLTYVIDVANSPSGDRVGDFTGKVRNLGPEDQGRNDYLQRAVEIRLTSAITWSTTP